MTAQISGHRWEIIPSAGQYRLYEHEQRPGQADEITDHGCYEDLQSADERALELARKRPPADPAKSPYLTADGEINAEEVHARARLEAAAAEAEGRSYGRAYLQAVNKGMAAAVSARLRYFRIDLSFGEIDTVGD